MEVLIAAVLAVLILNGMAWWLDRRDAKRSRPSHYTSTYCIHGDHADCRLACKVCAAPCKCACHRKGQANG